jgi:hypothetical protein
MSAAANDDSTSPRNRMDFANFAPNVQNDHGSLDVLEIAYLCDSSLLERKIHLMPTVLLTEVLDISRSTLHGRINALLR